MITKLACWAVAFAAGMGLTHVVKQADLSYLQPGTTSLPFMLIALTIIMLIYQVRVNLENRPPPGARFVFAPPDATILGEVLAFFAGNFLLLNPGV